jgi:hypothetical protein
MAVDGDPQHLALHSSVEALDHAVGLGRGGPCPAVLHLQLAAGLLEGLGREARAAVGEHVRDLEGSRSDRLVEEGDRAAGQFVVLNSQMHPARAAVDSHVEEALAALAISGLQLGQVLDVDVEEAEVVLLERAALPPTLVSRRQAVQALGLENAVDGIAVEVRQEVRDHEGEVIEGKARGLARRAQTMARSSSVAFQGSLCGRAERSWQSAGPRLRHLRMVSVLTPKRLASTPVGSAEPAISARTAGVVRALG